jgi:hypothetical protein
MCRRRVPPLSARVGRLRCGYTGRRDRPLAAASPVLRRRSILRRLRCGSRLICRTMTKIAARDVCAGELRTGAGRDRGPRRRTQVQWWLAAAAAPTLRLDNSRIGPMYRERLTVDLESVTRVASPDNVGILVLPTVGPEVGAGPSARSQHTRVWRT